MLGKVENMLVCRPVVDEKQAGNYALTDMRRGFYG
jgi:hypothetical protein